MCPLWLFRALEQAQMILGLEHLKNLIKVSHDHAYTCVVKINDRKSYRSNSHIKYLCVIKSSTS